MSEIIMNSKTDIIIAGAGAAGLISALALARKNYAVTLIGPQDQMKNGRTVALFEASIHILKAMELWPIVEPIASPLRIIRFVDDTHSLFHVPDIDLYADEIDLDAFGYNIENAALVERLTAYARTQVGITLLNDFVDDVAFYPDRVDITTRQGHKISGHLIIGADGKNSPVRAKAGVKAHNWSYPQQAITALLTHQKPHHNMSVEFHTAYGPCTLVPMRDDEHGRHRSSLVWLMTKDNAERRLSLSDDRFLGELERQVKRIYGTMAFASVRGSFPMSGVKLDRLIAQRTALVADAGHFFPPIGAQGLNLGIRDIAQLAACLSGDAGAAENLRRYNEARKGDIALRTFGVDLLNRSLLFNNVVADGARALGLMALAKIGPLRRRIMREGVMPTSARLYESKAHS
jgi:2-octaprenyl-6-methoxyphenol hydroxylase